MTASWRRHEIFPHAVRYSGGQGSGRRKVAFCTSAGNLPFLLRLQSEAELHRNNRVARSGEVEIGFRRQSGGEARADEYLAP